MFDKVTGAVLGAVNASADGCYRIVDVRELLGALPPRVKADAAKAEAALRFLAANGYVSVKYSQDGVYCVAALPKGREAQRQALRVRTRVRRRAGAFLLPFAGAFAGGAAAALLCALLF